jgi:Uncharacterized protein conserved in bacteria
VRRQLKLGPSEPATEVEGVFIEPIGQWYDYEKGAWRLIDLAKLAEPFEEHEIEWRIMKGGQNKETKKWWAKCLAYMDARAVMDRLDKSVGPENWRDIYEEGPGGGLFCGISIRIRGEWVTKWDGQEIPPQSSNEHQDRIKSALSGALKRAAVKWGIGRYLYDLKESWAIVVDNNGRYSTPFVKNGPYIHWNPPPLPAWAKPKHDESPRVPDRAPDFVKDVPEPLDNGDDPVVDEDKQENSGDKITAFQKDLLNKKMLAVGMNVIQQRLDFFKHVLGDHPTKKDAEIFINNFKDYYAQYMSRDLI